MFLSQVTFGSAPTGVDPTEVDDAIVSYLSSLQKNGQICGDFLHSLCNQYRCCPSYNGAWRITYDVRLSPQFWRFPFRCVDCRLVSQMADDNFEPQWAHIGEHR